MRNLMMALLAVLVIPAAALADPSFSITGYVDGEFQAVQNPDDSTPEPDDTTWDTSFGDASEALFWVKGSPAENASFTTEIVYQQWDNEIVLNQAAINWNMAGEKFGMQLGKFYFPFGIEARSRYSTTNKLVTQPILRDPTTGQEYGFTGWTDNGFGAGGTMQMNEGSSWNWAVAVANGFAEDTDNPGLTPQLTDQDNNNKSFGGRVEIMPQANQLNIGGSFVTGAWSDTTGENNSYTRAGAHMISNHVQNLDIRGEYMWQSLSDFTPGTDLSSMGFYAQGAYRYPLEGGNYIEPVLRFSWLDPNGDADDDTMNQIAVGLGFSPVEHFAIKGEFDINSESGTEFDNNEATLQGVYGW
jgi:hypothetical protein